MFYIQKQFTFEASHILPHHQGKCGRLHGHSWRMTVVLRDPVLIPDGPSRGMVTDFYDISTAVKPLLEGKLDHWHLNDTTGLENPTSEELARWIFRELKPVIPQLFMVSVEETCTSKASYFEPLRVGKVGRLLDDVQLKPEKIEEVWELLSDPPKKEEKK